MSISSISVSPKYILLKKGENYLNQTVKVDGDTTTSCLEWCSAAPSIAGVHPDSGRILANGVGKTKVYVNSIFDTTKKDYIEVEVTDGEICVQSIELSTTSVTIEKGDTFELSATVSPYNATNKSINWSSSNTNVATVSNGVVTAKAKGWTFIYARANDCSEVEAMCFVEVTEDVLVTSVTVSWSNDEVALNKNLTVGKVAYAFKTVCPCDATNKAVTWSSDDESVAIVNPDSGLVTAKAVGEATISATAQDGSNIKGCCTITVNPPVEVTGVEICPTSLTMYVGDIEYLCASITPSNATNQAVTWCSSNENVATVELHTGKVTAKSFGETVITATSTDGVYSDTLLLYVNGISDGELTIFSCVTDSSSVGSANTNGHAWLTYKNTTHFPVEILGVTLLPGREISFGAWGLPNMPRKGIWTGLEAFQVAEQGKNHGRVSLTIPLNSSEFEFMKSRIHEENEYDLSSYNCAIVASLVWNAVAPHDKKLSVGLPLFTTPQVVCKAIENISGYEVNRPIMSPNTSEIGYPSADGFVAVGQDDWRMSYALYEYIINLFTIL